MVAIAQPKRIPRLMIVLGAAAAGLFIAVAILGYIATRTGEDSDVLLESAPTLAPGERIDAYVNGVPVSMAGIDVVATLTILAEHGTESSPSLLDLAINNELLRQEAIRRGLAPSDDAVMTLVEKDQAGYLAHLSAGTLPADVATRLELLVVDHPLEAWHEDAATIAAYRAMLTNSLLVRDEAGPLRSDPDAEANLVDDLRKKARIELVPLGE